MSDISGSKNFDEILPIMTDLVNKSIERNYFPESEKVAIVKPIVKGKQDTQCLGSF